ncbi:hypothetical protein U9M48_002171 [Paspalum notatum var. saurae]|uniref:Serpin domain-containing protein n=1 Tax=Paspalum notatum var. saurae TaxID=547442 RepID=A0AAQ3PJ30_PASNO
MSKFEMLKVACMDRFKVLELPYKSFRSYSDTAKGEVNASVWPDASEATQYSMFIFLPDARDGIATMVDMITASPAFMYSILAEMEEYVNLKLPKFKITFNWATLKDTLCQMGLTLPFSPEAANLQGMCQGDEGDGVPLHPLFLTKVAHMAVVNVHEKGTEAAAVTFYLCGGGRPERVVEFTADHPFTFFIMEKRSGVIVFAGHVLDPTK